MKLFFRNISKNTTVTKNLIILHGLFGSGDNWLTIARRFSENFNIYLPDLRNHGQSPHNNIHDYDSMAEDLHEFFIDNKIERASLIGHSMGGKASMKFAFEYPEMVEKLIVVDIAPREYQTSNKYIVEMLLKIDLKMIKTREQADELLSQKIANKPIRQFILKNLFRNDDMSFSWKLNLKALSENLSSMGGFNNGNKFEKETLFIRGENSNYIKDSDYKLIYDTFPKGKIETIENAGHWLHTENPERTYHIIKDFL
ncbi:MAG: alpha/beta fold hydrolase [Cyanobacteriota bacterium]